MNGVINAVIQNDDEPIDIEVFDIAKCVDSLWLKECLNNLYEAGLDNSNLKLLYEGNRECYISVKTPNGQTDRILFHEIVMQGSVCGPLCSTATMDKIVQKSYSSGPPSTHTRAWSASPPVHGGRRADHS